MIKVKKIVPDAIMPEKGREGDACFDLWTSEDSYILKGGTVAIPTGICIELPEKYEAEIRPRSGISLKGVKANTWDGKDKITITEDTFKCSVIQGTIDENYRGEIKIIFRNESDKHIKISKHTKLAQMKINEVPVIKLVEVDELSDSNRGSDGFGSSDVK